MRLEVCLQVVFGAIFLLLNYVCFGLVSGLFALDLGVMIGGVVYC